MKPRYSIILGGLAAAVVANRTLLRPWHQRWGATDEEAREPMAGDGLVAEPAVQVSRAITIGTPVDQVWPWVAQIGADRGGFYSYAFLENLFGYGIRNADELSPDWQQRSVGDLVYADATGTRGWYVMHVVPGEVLVLKMADVTTGEPMRREQQGWEFLWTFTTKDLGDNRTRLVVRERVAIGGRVIRLLTAPTGFISFVMTRKMLLAIKARAERTRRLVGASQAH